MYRCGDIRQFEGEYNSSSVDPSRIDRSIGPSVAQVGQKVFETMERNTFGQRLLPEKK